MTTTRAGSRAPEIVVGAPGRSTLGARRAVWWVVGLAGLAALVRLLFVGAQLSADEAGFLTVAGQWRPGDSLYGDLWVDRPPGLVLLFELAAALGGQVPLRVLGALAAAGSVGAAAWLAWRVSRHPGAMVAVAVLVTTLLSSKWLQVNETNGEVLGLPFLLLGLVALVVAHERVAHERVGRGAGAVAVPGALAGACAALAGSVKQNLLDVVVVGLLLTGALVLQRRPRHAAALLGAAVLGAALVTTVLLGVAWARGTAPTDLWDALVTFRVEAGELIRTSATSATQERAGMLLLAGMATGLPVLALCLPFLTWGRPTRATPHRHGVAADPVWSWTVVGLLTFEVASIALGGSYWWHYLVVLVPGSALLLALAWPSMVAERGRRAGQVLLAPFVVSAAVGLGWLAVSPPALLDEHQELVDHLREQGASGATGLLAFGGANLMYDAGLDPAYQHLWSLPARTRDAQLTELTAVLADADRRPEWIVVTGRGFGTWGIDPDAAARAGVIARAHYEVEARLEAFTVLHRRD